MNLRDAAERVGILHVDLGLTDEFAAVEQLAHASGGLDLSLVGTHCMNGMGERLDAAVIGLERDGCDDVSPTAQTLSLDEGPHSVSAHVLGAIEQGQTFLRTKLDGFPTHLLAQVGTAHALALVLDLAQAHDGQAEVCQRHEVARSAHRTLLVNNGIHVVVEQVDKTLHGVKLHARVAVGE